MKLEEALSELRISCAGEINKKEIIEYFNYIIKEKLKEIEELKEKIKQMEIK